MQRASEQPLRVSNVPAPGAGGAWSDADGNDMATAPPLVEGAELELLIPLEDVSDPVVSIVIPAVNEELTISDFVEWCKEGLETAGVSGEILIVDSSIDRTAEIALAHNARVLKTPKRGLGRAYIDA